MIRGIREQIISKTKKGETPILHRENFCDPASPQRLQSGFDRYGTAIIAFAITLALRFALDPWMPGDRIFILFVPAVIGTTFLAGVLPGLLTASLSGLAIWYFFLPPYRSFALNLDGIIGLATYVVVMGMVLGLLHSLNRTIDQLAKERSHSRALAEREKLLAHEIRHRTKNLIVVVKGIADRTLRGDLTLLEARETLIGRLMALGRADDQLVSSTSGVTTLTYLVHSELDIFAGRFEMEGPDIALDQYTAQNLSLVLHELATNASKYGALSNPTGRISLAWSERDGQLKFTWSESGGPPVKCPTRRGFGTALIHGAFPRTKLRYDLRGLIYESDIQLRPPGTP